MSGQVIYSLKGHNGTIRVGCLRVVNKIIDTPTLLVSTKRLCIPHLTPDVFHRTLPPSDYCGLQVEVEPLVEDCQVIPKSSPFTIDKFIGFPEIPIFLAINDPSYYQGSGIDTVKMNNGMDWVSLVNSGGISSFHFKDSLKLIIDNLKPTLFITPTDHYHPRINRLKRIKKSSENSKKYYDLSMQACKDSLTKCVPSVFLHEISGESDEKDPLVRQEMKSRLSIGDNSTTVSIIYDNLSTAKYYLSLLSDSTLIILRGSIPPEDIHELCKLGVGIFDTQFATDLATKGLAINCSFSKDRNVIVNRLDLSEEAFFDDQIPLDDNCKCVACSGSDKTTRSYIHHLIKTNEMLALVFLSSHNLWQYSSILRSLRSPL